MSATQFDEGTRWRGKLVPAAGEMSARFGAVRVPSRRLSGEPTDLEKNERDRVRRAQRMVRRFVVANSLSQFVTLTFADLPGSAREAEVDVVNYFRRVKYRFQNAPSVWTLERGSQCGRIHAHGLVGDLDSDVLGSLWGLGRTQHQMYDLDAESLRAAAGYLSKDFGQCSLLSSQTYRVTKGFQPMEIALTGSEDPGSVIWEASQCMGADPTRIQDSPRGAALTAFWEVWR